MEYEAWKGRNDRGDRKNLPVPTWHEEASHCTFLEPFDKTWVPQLHSDSLRMALVSFHRVVRLMQILKAEASHTVSYFNKLYIIHNRVYLLCSQHITLYAIIVLFLPYWAMASQITQCMWSCLSIPPSTWQLSLSIIPGTGQCYDHFSLIWHRRFYTSVQWDSHSLPLF